MKIKLFIICITLLFAILSPLLVTPVFAASGIPQETAPAPVDIEIGGISLIMLVLGLVEFAKKLGISGKGSLIMVIVLGLIFGVGGELLAQFPAAAVWIIPVVRGLAFALAASGLYDLSKKLSPSTGG